MERHYGHLSLEERCTIAQLHQAGRSIRQIAATLDRSPSSISRDLKRNSGTQVGYKPSYAAEQAAARRWSGSRLERAGQARACQDDQHNERSAQDRNKSIATSPGEERQRTG